MKVVALTIFVAIILYLIIQFLVTLVGLVDAGIIVLCLIIGYYLAKDYE